MRLTDCWTASALGVGNEATLENYLRGEAPGFAEREGIVVRRPVWFGSVPCELPEFGDSAMNTRSNRLLRLAVTTESSFARRVRGLVARMGAPRVGVVIGASNTGIEEAETLVDHWLDAAAVASVPPPEGFDFSMIELGTPALCLRRLIDAEGPAYTISTACSSAAKAFGAARRLLAAGVCDAVVTGGVDGRCRFAANGFEALGALSAGRCRPLADDRDGINLGEGVALFTLEREGGGVVLAGVGESSDAHHATAPDPEGGGAELSMRAALADAGIAPDEIEYLNLHGTGTPANDAMEMKAVRRVFGSVDTPTRRIESTKSLTGHCLGAAGAVEAALCWLLVSSGRVRNALSNSFAFGGSNASVLFAR